MSGNEGGVEGLPPLTHVCAACGQAVDKFHARWEPCVLRSHADGRIAVTHLNQVLARNKDGDAVTRGFMIDARENHSWAEVWKDGEIPVSRRAASRRTFVMGGK